MVIYASGAPHCVKLGAAQMLAAGKTLANTRSRCNSAKRLAVSHAVRVTQFVTHPTCTKPSVGAVRP